MARHIGPVCKICRHSGEKLLLKGERCATAKCSMERRAVRPGRRTGGRQKVSEWGLQLKEKQKARRTYGVLEKQFHRYFVQAKKTQGVTGDNLIQLLESRLDNIVYQLGFASSRSQARQEVRHGHITLNGRKVDIPSCLVKPGDVVAWREKSTKTELYKRVSEEIQDRIVPDWLTLDKDHLSGRMLALPTRDQVGVRFNESAIVEYYSR